MLISNDYLTLNKELHARNPNYGISGSRHAEKIKDIADSITANSILDYGCGKGTLKNEIGNDFWEIIEYDPAIEGKEENNTQQDLVVCTDVLEHIEPGLLDAVLDDIRRCSLKACFLTVSTVEALKTLADGRNAHLIVEPSAWWLSKLLERFELVSFQRAGNAFLFEGEPK